jgi:hypothetical protein
MDFCGICEQAHERRTQPVTADHDALFGDPLCSHGHPDCRCDIEPILVVPFDRERRFREEFEVPSLPPGALDG